MGEIRNELLKPIVIVEIRVQIETKKKFRDASDMTLNFSNMLNLEHIYIVMYTLPNWYQN